MDMIKIISFLMMKKLRHAIKTAIRVTIPAREKVADRCLLIRKEQSGMLAAVLLAVGIGLPVVYFGSFLSQVNMQSLQRKLKPARRVYTVTLRESGILVRNDQRREDPLEMDWSSIQKAFRRKGCIYLYVTPAKAFLLPDGQSDASDEEVWKFLTEHLGEEKCR